MARTRNTSRWALAAAILLLAAATPALALEQGGVSMEVLVNGRRLAEYAARGTIYIEAQRGHEYSIRLVNRTGERVAVALSVDGLNTIDAKTTPARTASKWILGPYQSMTLSGWQIDAQNARKFFFTTEDQSYGAWLGRTKNLGVITAAVFRERRVEPPAAYRFRHDEEGAPGAADRAVPLPAPPRGAEKSAAAPSEAKRAPLSDDLAATGIGRRFDHSVVEVDFDLDDRPPTVLQMRYEYREALVKLGVLPRPDEERALARREHAHGFSDGFCPDPFRGRE